MRLSDLRSAYEGLSSKASDIVRQLSLAGIGLIWLFRDGSDKAPLVNEKLLRASLFIVLALFCDFLQYLAGATIWSLFFRYKEKQGVSESDDFLAPKQLTWPTWILFFLKAAMMLIAYSTYLIPFLFKKFVR